MIVEPTKGEEVEQLLEKGGTSSDLSGMDNSPNRKLKARHLEMIAIGGAIGTGLFLGSGKVLQYGGPLGMLLAYVLTGFIVYFVMISLGEVATSFPINGGFASHATRFVDPALGFAVGWNFYFIYALSLPVELIATANLLQFWWPQLPKWVVILSVLAIIVTINLCGVAWFGEVEFVLSAIKIAALLCFIILSVFILLHDQIGFTNYQQGELFGPKGFAGFFQIMATTFFAYSGTELVAVSAQDAANPKQAVPQAIKSTFWRITLFYTTTVFLIGLLVSQTNEKLRRADLLASPFVIAIEMANIPSAADIINGVIFIAVLSAANSSLYATSRTLQGLALAGNASQYFKTTSSDGVPVRQVLTSSLFACLAFLSEVKGGNATLEILLSVAGMQVMITYLLIAVIHLRFRNVLEHHGHPVESLPYVAPMFPFGPWFVILSLLVMMTGMIVVPLLGKTSLVTLFSAFGGLVLYLASYFGYKYYHRSSYLGSMVRMEECDIITGRVW